MQEGKLSWPAALGALGVVYGDIGTSPLYALDTAVAVSGGGPHDVAAMMGVLSLIFWSLLIVVTLQYVVFMLRADNQGEGGILALFALVQRKPLELGRWARWVVALALAGAALFYCDALITPAISVLSAVEGLKMLDPELGPIVLPTTVAVLVLLFVIQRRGTARIGKLFGPVMVLWFVAIGVSGAVSLARNPAVLLAINPLYGIDLLAYRPGLALAILGAVFLALTGGEALYADMGHFGKGPVRLAWFALVWPALLLSYFGQGAYRLSSSAAVDHSVFALVPAPLLAPLVVVATAATVIASQAVISGAFSVTRQAVQLDLLPRMRVLQTSAQEAGQIYVPVVNYVLLVAVLGFVLAFGSSAALASAYGAAVAGT
ncbi:MAG TPA: KUP/HAK/KT family potassium transporter, partial [Steroidobacteraceae bacterium]